MSYFNKILKSSLAFCAATAIATLSPQSASATEAAEGLDKPVLVFKSGEGDYPHFRIPTLTSSKKGTILAFAEGRFIKDDHGQNDIVLKRSTDGGKTWGELQVIHADKELVMVNPSAVALENGRIVLLYETFPRHYHARAGRHHKMMPAGFGEHTQKLLARVSDDDGETWSKAIELQKTSRAGKNIISSGSPANAIQLKVGKYKGRILVPLFLTERMNHKDRTWRNAVLYSDNNGNSWKLSETVPIKTTEAGNECLISETDEGHILMNSRSQHSHSRLISRSTDGGKTWTAFEYSTELKNRPCNCGLLKFSYGENNRTFFTYNNSTKHRRNGFVALSKDDGKTWAIKKQVIPGFFGYSQLTKVDNDTLGMIYEPFESPREVWNLYFLNIPIKWIETE